MLKLSLPFLKKCCTTKKSWCHITLILTHNCHLFTMAPLSVVERFDCSFKRHCSHKNASNGSTWALAQGCVIILKKSVRLFQILIDIISQSWVTEKAYCIAKVLRDNTVLTNKAAKLLIVSKQNAKPSGGFTWYSVNTWTKLSIITTKFQNKPHYFHILLVTNPITTEKSCLWTCILWKCVRYLSCATEKLFTIHVRLLLF